MRTGSVPRMVRLSKLVLGFIVLLVGGGIALAYSGAAPGIVSPDLVPGTPPTGLGIIIGVVIAAALVAAALDRRAWKATGSAVGLTTGDGGFQTEPTEDGSSTLLGEPTLSGTVGGRPVRAWTYTTGGGGDGGSSTTHTVVQAQLRDPVEWTATFGVATGDAPADHDIDAVDSSSR